jgi:LysR family transcriptional regulator (chromosome initiation inhibitor)
VKDGYIMIDYASLRAIAAIVQTGSFEKAARMLHVTPSAVSQRVRQLEDRLGTALVVRASPCTATEKGAWLCRHMEQVGMLESELFTHLPGLGGSPSGVDRVTVHVATNADSLGTWFLAAITHFAVASDHLVNVAVDDQDHTAEWLQRAAFWRR